MKERNTLQQKAEELFAALKETAAEETRVALEEILQQITKVDEEYEQQTVWEYEGKEIRIEEYLALKKIEKQIGKPPKFKAENGRVTELYLSKMNLNETPDLSNLTKLQNLFLGYNQLTETPDVSKLAMLQELNLRNNRLNRTPGVSNLTSLQELSLNNNPLLQTQEGAHQLEQMKQNFPHINITPDEYKI